MIALLGIASTVIRPMSALAVISESFVSCNKTSPLCQELKNERLPGYRVKLCSLYIYSVRIYSLLALLCFDSAFFAHAAPNKERYILSKKHKPLDSTKINLKFALAWR